MKTKTLYLLATYVFLVLLGMASCDDCDGQPSKFKTVEISSKFQEVISSDPTDPDLEFADLERDTVLFSRLAIRFKLEQESYGSNSLVPLSLITSAYACDPAPPTTEEILESIVIESSTDFNVEYPAGSDLSPLFDVVVYSNDIYNERFDLNEYLNTTPLGPNWLILILKEKPTETKAFSFEIDYLQDGIDQDLFELMTESVVIKSE